MNKNVRGLLLFILYHEYQKSFVRTKKLFVVKNLSYIYITLFDLEAFPKIVWL